MLEELNIHWELFTEEERQLIESAYSNGTIEQLLDNETICSYPERTLEINRIIAG